MNNLIKAVTIGDIEGIGIKLLINIWKYKKKQVGNFILITNYNYGKYSDLIYSHLYKVYIIKLFMLTNIFII